MYVYIGLIYTSSRDRLVKVWNPNDGKLCRELKGTIF